MMSNILCIKTDQPEAFVAVYSGKEFLSQKTWHAHRQLSETIHVTIQEVLAEANLELEELDGVAVYHGPGSFTGLRIGVSVANALANGLSVPVAGSTGDDWVQTGYQRIQNGSDGYVTPEYGADPHITTPRH